LRKMTKNNTLLIDGDMVAFQITIGLEREIQWDEEVHTLHSRWSDCVDIFADYMKNITEVLNARRCIFAFSGANNFRKAVLPTYKFNRKATRKPLCYARFRRFVEDEFESKVHDVLEADDLLGIMATNGKYDNTIIVSDDKDLLSIPGRCYRLNELHNVSLEEADRKHLMQTLTGDVADGYKGCPGIGEKKAEVILKNGTWSEVLKAFEAAKLTEEDALQQARVARICRVEDFDFVKGDVNLWTP